jgi:YhcH/YjgK/YiaL family protein
MELKMIYDCIKNAGLYKGLSENFKKAFSYLENLDIDSLEKDKRYEIEGSDMGFKVTKIECKAPDNDFYEAHIKFADIQLIVSGTEYMGYQNLNKLEPREKYDEKKDIAWYRGEGMMMKYEKGDFAVFFPEDAHMPCRNDGKTECESYKLVIKVKL